MLGTVWPDFGERPDNVIQAGTPWPVFADVGHGLIDNASRSVDDPGQADRVRAWWTDADALLKDARRHIDLQDEVALPPRLTTSQIVRLHANPQAFRDDLRRPMPRPADRGAG
ncbi:ATP-dependent helicase, partial [Xanthomonas citri pv. citri]|nr:ATP-dependent helicase [Xanthomonas citri pv. citri]